MTVYVLREGRLVDRRMAAMLDAEERDRRAAGLAFPYVSRIEPFESPVTGVEITSWRQREAEMRAVDAYDPRDLPGHVHPKGRAAQPKKAQGHG